MHHNHRRNRPAPPDFGAGSHAGGGSSLDTPENIATRERGTRGTSDGNAEMDRLASRTFFRVRTVTDPTLPPKGKAAARGRVDAALRFIGFEDENVIRHLA